MLYNQTVTHPNTVIADLLDQDRDLLEQRELHDTRVTFSATAVEIARELARLNGLLKKIEQATTGNR